NALPYGLAAYAFTGSAQTATMIADALQSGMVGVNSIAVSTPETPFGGVKESGYGSEGGIEGLAAYLNTKFISQGRPILTTCRRRFGRRRPITAALPVRAVVTPFFERHPSRAGIAGRGTNTDISQL